MNKKASVSGRKRTPFSWDAPRRGAGTRQGAAAERLRGPRERAREPFDEGCEPVEEEK